MEAREAVAAFGAATAERERRRMAALASIKFEINGNSLKVMTTEQRDTIIRLSQDSAWTTVRISPSFDLPDGWLYFVLEGPTGPALHGGIDPEGRAST